MHYRFVVRYAFPIISQYTRFIIVYDFSLHITGNFFITGNPSVFIFIFFFSRPIPVKPVKQRNTLSVLRRLTARTKKKKGRSCVSVSCALCFRFSLYSDQFRLSLSPLFAQCFGPSVHTVTVSHTRAVTVSSNNIQHTQHRTNHFSIMSYATTILRPFYDHFTPIGYTPKPINTGMNDTRELFYTIRSSDVMKLRLT